MNAESIISDEVVSCSGYGSCASTSTIIMHSMFDAHALYCNGKYSCAGVEFISK